MVTRRIRSEYMKKFKDPKWETFSKCYDEMLRYRLNRRLLEQTHNPWFWSGSDSDSDSGGRSPPPPPKNNQVLAEQECEGQRSHRTTGPVPRLPLQEEEEEKEDDKEEVSAETDLVQHQPQQTKASKSSKDMWRSHRVSPVTSRQPREDSKSRHSFALYGSGEKNTDIAARKTHNVGPTASTNDIHKSALRAKTRREVERQIQMQKSERRKVKSADVDKTRKLVQPEFNPWLTEYMRCFSARSR
ncbi:centriole, cilia and spindle-associated [Solea senegalensis]|uniref:Centriole, cilia and spindle-associated n=1 Tax=Solea senegalensis TaxID=28829 RepID=A0AAV6Q2K8_SOLSE|nr:centriole, cilia and spindle-associated protein isoform X2 [Solea senegalensis]KAG7481910.1 centriole, cilia and spindle-associated [Solea senegalensis]